MSIVCLYFSFSLLVSFSFVGERASKEDKSLEDFEHIRVSKLIGNDVRNNFRCSDVGESSSAYLVSSSLFLLVSFSFVSERASKEDKNSSFSSSSFVDHCKENFGFFQTPECFFRFPLPFLLHPPFSIAITHCVSRFKSLPLHEFFIFPNLCAHCLVIPTTVRVFFFFFYGNVISKEKRKKGRRGRSERSRSFFRSDFV